MARDDQHIQGLITAFGEFRQEMGQHIGELKKGQENLENSFTELKTNLREKFKTTDASIQDHSEKLNKAEGSISTWKWIIGIGSAAGSGSILIEAMKWFHLHK